MSMPSQSAPQYDPVAEYQKGMTAYQAKDFKGATTAFRHVLSVTSNHAPAQYLLGSSYMELGEFKKAKGPLEKAVRYDATMIEARRDLAISHRSLALLAAQSGDHAKARHHARAGFEAAEAFRRMQATPDADSMLAAMRELVARLEKA